MKRERPDVLVYVSADAMSVKLACRIVPGKLEALRARIEDRIAELGIAEEAIRIDLDEWLRELEARPARSGRVMLAQGERPSPSQDGRIEWAGPFFEKGFHIDPETGAVDYRKRLARDDVEAGQLLAQVIAPVEGRDGLDVFGKRVQARKPKRASIASGPNVRRDEEDRYFATTSGRIRWVDGRLSVDNVLRIEGNVGLETGDVRHPGAVVVEHDILEGSTVEAEGDIEVKGVVEPSNLVTGGNLVVRAGVSGDDGYRIRAKGSVQARYIQDAEIDAGDDVVVGNEILRSTIRSRGCVRVTDGRIVGGAITALRGIEARTIGSDANVRTSLVAGVDFALSGEMNAWISRLVNLRETRERILHALDRAGEFHDPDPTDERSRTARLTDRLLKTDKELEETTRHLGEAGLSALERTRFRVLARAKIFPNVSLEIKGAKRSLLREEKGPVEAIVQRGRITFQRPK